MISVVHDLSLAQAYGTEAMLLKQGRVAAAGSSGDVFSRDNLRAVYEMDVHGWMQTLCIPWKA